MKEHTVCMHLNVWQIDLAFSRYSTILYYYHAMNVLSQIVSQISLAASSSGRVRWLRELNSNKKLEDWMVKVYNRNSQSIVTRARNISTTFELVRNANYWAQPQTY